MSESNIVPAQDGHYVLGYFPEDERQFVTVPIVAWQVDTPLNRALPITAGVPWDVDQFPWICYGSNHFFNIIDEVFVSSIEQIAGYKSA